MLKSLQILEVSKSKVVARVNGEFNLVLTSSGEEFVEVGGKRKKLEELKYGVVVGEVSEELSLILEKLPAKSLKKLGVEVLTKDLLHEIAQKRLRRQKRVFKKVVGGTTIVVVIKLGKVDVRVDDPNKVIVGENYVFVHPSRFPSDLLKVVKVLRPQKRDEVLQTLVEAGMVEKIPIPA